MMVDDKITEQLFVQEAPVPSDIAMVFGAVDEIVMGQRARRGAELYLAGYVPRLLLTGGCVPVRGYPESAWMAECVQKYGVPNSALLLEDRSSNTFENVMMSVRLLRERGFLNKIGTIALVSSEWHMRRVLLTAKKYFPGNVHFVCCPTCEGCNRENWLNSDASRRMVYTEADLLELFLKTGAL